MSRRLLAARNRRVKMEKLDGKCRMLSCFIVLSVSLFWLFIYCFLSPAFDRSIPAVLPSDYVASFARFDTVPHGNNTENQTAAAAGAGDGNIRHVTRRAPPPARRAKRVKRKRTQKPVPKTETKPEETNAVAFPCAGRYVYVHRLPLRFNYDMLKNCRTISMWTDMCRYTSNGGLGPVLRDKDKERVFSKKGWYSTDQFALDVIFSNRMRQYRCLTNDSSEAAAIFVPFFAGFDIQRHLWGHNVSVRDAAALDLVKWLVSRPEWRRMGGRDHFLVGGRIAWDFRRLTDEESDWGNKLLLLPESRNMTVLVIESEYSVSSHDFSIPYPTYFHPAADSEVVAWQSRMMRQRRPWLFSFAGAQRPNMTASIRGQIIEQCSSSKRCRLLDCDSWKDECRSPASVMKMFQSSVFCLQPPGDSYTRRSTFDSMLAGCIPVFFHPGSAYVQYHWHLPRNYTHYSVFIPEKGVREGKVNIETKLLEIPQTTVKAMQKTVVGLIPGLVYADPKSRLGKLEDAFDIAVKGVIEKIDRTRKEMRGENGLMESANRDHRWDSYFPSEPIPGRGMGF